MTQLLRPDASLRQAPSLPGRAVRAGPAAAGRRALLSPLTSKAQAYCSAGCVRHVVLYGELADASVSIALHVQAAAGQ